MVSSFTIQKAKQYHPDKNSGDAEKEELFKIIHIVSTVLLDPNLRRLYDGYGSLGLDSSHQIGYKGRTGVDSSVPESTMDPPESSQFYPRTAETDIHANRMQFRTAVSAFLS